MTEGFGIKPYLIGERGRNRTFNLLIKSQLLCQLSYAPLNWELLQNRGASFNIA